ncbi:hypothetical protein, partial [Sinorhizobium fredii]
GDLAHRRLECTANEVDAVPLMRLNRTTAYRSSRPKSGRRNNNEKRKLAPRRLKKAFFRCELNSQSVYL